MKYILVVNHIFSEISKDKYDHLVMTGHASNVHEVSDAFVQEMHAENNKDAVTLHAPQGEQFYEVFEQKNTDEKGIEYYIWNKRGRFVFNAPLHYSIKDVRENILPYVKEGFIYVGRNLHKVERRGFGTVVHNTWMK